MKKTIIFILLIALVCLAASSCGGSCKAKDDTVGQTESSSASSTPLESPSPTETPAKAEESTAPESTAPESSTVSPTSHYHEYSEIWSADKSGQAVYACKTCNFAYIGELLYAPEESK